MLERKLLNIDWILGTEQCQQLVLFEFEDRFSIWDRDKLIKWETKFNTGELLSKELELFGTKDMICFKFKECL